MHPGTVTLRVRDLDAARRFYATVVGLADAGGETAAVASMTAVDGRPLVRLIGEPDARVTGGRHTGLFHLALLVPSRLELAHALARIAHARHPLDGASDHLVSEALYLSDPEGNGIEIYRDRPRGEWPHAADGQLQMATLPLDLDGVIGELSAEDRAGAPPGMSAGTEMGHVHLRVADLTETERFWAGVVGLDVTVRGYPGALFLSSGGYHHHIGANTWASAGAPPPPPGAAGLDHLELLAESDGAVAAITERASAAGLTAEPAPGGIALSEPAGARVVIRTA